MKSNTERLGKFTQKLLISISIVFYCTASYSQTVDAERVQTIIENRCTVCHGCYDAPCQLKLTAYEGLLRGASKTQVYTPKRIIAERPTRLFIDAQTERQWRELGFESVIETGSSSKPGILAQMLDLKVDTTLVPGQPLPADFPLDLNRDMACPAPSEMDKFVREHRQYGMPYGMAALPELESSLLKRWAETGYLDFTGEVPVTDSLLTEISEWENYFNSAGNKRALISRYIYEHLFLGQLQFKSDEHPRNFRLLRSATPSGTEVVEIPTTHPNDAPTVVEFYYRIVPVTETMLDKTQFVYELSPDRLRDINELFYSEDWSPTNFPGYSNEEAINPFLAFRDIPSRIRYQFMLDDADFFISNFIKGPVCRGQVALNVIPDYFFVGFLSPDFDLSIADPNYLVEGMASLGLPSKETDIGDFLQIWLDRLQTHQEYLDFRDSAYRKNPKTASGFPLDAIWSGTKPNDINFLTVFRHFDSATVVAGLVGGEAPKSAWIIDYPIFERIYYDLVVNFNVFGNVSHQVLTRLYMDYLRMESEGLFLSFLPPETRQPLLEDWYRGMTAQVKVFWAHSNLLFDNPTQVEYLTDSPREELLTLLKQRVVAKGDNLSVAVLMPVNHRRLADLDSRIAGSEPWVGWMPELNYIVITDNDDNVIDIASLIRNKAHTNISFIFGEEDRRVPTEDTSTLVLGTLGSYPNFFFSVSESKIGTFVESMRSINSKTAMNTFVEQYGVRRTDPRIWTTLDAIHEWRREHIGNKALLDISRYENL